METLAAFVAGYADANLEAGDNGVFTISRQGGRKRFKMTYDVPRMVVSLLHDGNTLARVPFAESKDVANDPTTVVIARFLVDMINLWCALDTRPCTKDDEIAVKEHVASTKHSWFLRIRMQSFDPSKEATLCLEEITRFPAQEGRKVNVTMHPPYMTCFAHLRCPLFDHSLTAQTYWRAIDGCCQLWSRSPWQPLV